MDKQVNSLEYLLLSSNSWEIVEKFSPSYSLLASSFCDHASGEDTIKVEVEVEDCSEDIKIKETVDVMQLKSNEKSNKFTTLDQSANLREKYYECEECQKKFVSKRSLTVHHRRKHGIRPFMCDVCGKSFASKSYLTDHGYIHSNERPFPCTVCHKAFKSFKTFKNHMSRHTGIKPHSCHFCGKSFFEKNTLKKHITTHTKECKAFQCDKCVRSFHTMSELKDHDFSHTGLSRHYCEVCGTYFSNSSALKKHTLLHLDNVNDPVKWQCDKCSQGFFNKGKLDEHTAFHCYYTALEALKTKRLGINKSVSS